MGLSRVDQIWANVPPSPATPPPPDPRTANLW